MSEEYRDLADRISRMQARIERMLKLRGSMVAEIEALIAEAETDIKTLELRRDALAAAGDSEDQ